MRRRGRGRESGPRFINVSDSVVPGPGLYRTTCCQAGLQYLPVHWDFATHLVFPDCPSCRYPAEWILVQGYR
jgi:hypothetical protein